MSIDSRLINDLRMESQATYDRSARAPWQEMEDKVLVMLPERQSIHELNETAGFIWKNILTTPTTEGLVRSAVLNYFFKDLDKIKSDIENTVNQMVELGLLYKTNSAVCAKSSIGPESIT